MLSCSGSKLFDILTVFLKDFFENVNFENKLADDITNYPARKELSCIGKDG